MLETNPYKILGVRKNASAKKIKQAFRTKAKKLHPDMNPSDDSEFTRIKHAYDILSDPIKRAIYDESGTIMDDTAEKEINNNMLTLFGKVVEITLQMKKEKNTDIFKIMKEKSKEIIANSKNNIVKIEKIIERMQDVDSRISNKKGNVLFNQLIKQQIGNQELEKEKLKKSIHISEQIIEKIKDYKYNIERENIRHGFYLNSDITSTSTGF